MKYIIWICTFLIFCNSVHLNVMRNIAKRQICSNGGGCNTCDGRSCNSCSNDVCCSSVSCNNCVSQCANECSTVRCKNNCVSGCTSSCQTPSCNVQSCSQCVNKCSSDCTTKDCVNNCASGCNQCKTTSTERDNDSVIIVPSPESSGSVIVNNTNNNLVNLTTHLNINNVIHNINNISIPVVVNSTNINNINLSSDIKDTSQPILHGSGSGGSQITQYPVPYPIIIPPAQQLIQTDYQQQIQPDNCCYVLHPRQCYTDDDGERRCFIRRSRECSSACTSPVITIEENTETVNSGCQYVRSWPYAYCGNYVRGDCNQCYSCGGGYNPSECFRQNTCSDTCRRSAPNCVPSQSGLQCY